MQRGIHSYFDADFVPQKNWVLQTIPISKIQNWSSTNPLGQS
jgi:hypothetical protein